MESYCGQELSELPVTVPIGIHRLDLSCNRFSSLASIKPIVNTLEELIVDDNLLGFNGKEINLPISPHLTTLTLNKNYIGTNGIKDLEQFLMTLAVSASNLTYISLLGNPACPDSLYRHFQQLKGNSNNDFTKEYETYDSMEENYLRYRLLVIHFLPKLKFLDSMPVTLLERKEANRRAQLGVLHAARPLSSINPLKLNKDNWEFRSESYNEFDSLFYTPLSANFKSNMDNGFVKKAKFGILSYKYFGKNSEGNRYIKNADL